MEPKCHIQKKKKKHTHAHKMIKITLSNIAFPEISEIIYPPSNLMLILNFHMRFMFS